MKHAYSALGFALLIACTTVEASPENEATESETPRSGAEIGETVYVDGLHVTPREVTEDSRCPRDTACVWEGQLLLRADVRGGSWEREMTLRLGYPQSVADGELTLTSATPETRLNTHIAPEDYRFEFSFDGGL